MSKTKIVKNPKCDEGIYHLEYNSDSSVPYPTIQAQEYNAEINLGGAIIQLHRDKPFTKSQIKHIKEYFGFDARNL